MLDKNDAVLVVIDIQGKLSTLMHNKENLFANTGRMIKGAQILELPIILTEQLPDKLGPTNPVIKELLPEAEVLVKDTFSCFGDKEFVSRLTELDRRQVLLTGIETHVCVYQTAVDLTGNGFGVHLVSDAVSSRIESNYRLGVKRIEQIGATITSVEMVLFEMLRVARGEQFRSVVKMLK